jgi:hypothetical protein
LAAKAGYNARPFSDKIEAAFTLYQKARSLRSLCTELVSSGG